MTDKLPRRTDEEWEQVSRDRMRRYYEMESDRVAGAVECGHRLWQLLHHGLTMAAAEGATRMGAEHLLLHMLYDPAAIPARELTEMGLDPSTVFTRLAEATRRHSHPPETVRDNRTSTVDGPEARVPMDQPGRRRDRSPGRTQ
ncbi:MULTISPECIES: hypothetical protein [unclassified Nocardia]|uniref:hypothetical protein n=1 Tax=unclassified Nocardia TaxID=2637762 RepID=UPI0024A94DFD|nr:MULTISPECIES: hypothetical protein [unclassified Nocardia]